MGEWKAQLSLRVRQELRREMLDRRAQQVHVEDEQGQRHTKDAVAQGGDAGRVVAF